MPIFYGGVALAFVFPHLIIENIRILCEFLIKERLDFTCKIVIGFKDLFVFMIKKIHILPESIRNIGIIITVKTCEEITIDQGLIVLHFSYYNCSHI